MTTRSDAGICAMSAPTQVAARRAGQQVIVVEDEDERLAAVDSLEQSRQDLADDVDPRRHQVTVDIVVHSALARRSDSSDRRHEPDGVAVARRDRDPRRAACPPRGPGAQQGRLPEPGGRGDQRQRTSGRGVEAFEQPLTVDVLRAPRRRRRPWCPAPLGARERRRGLRCGSCVRGILGCAGLSREPSPASQRAHRSVHRPGSPGALDRVVATRPSRAIRARGPAAQQLVLQPVK